MMEAHEDAVTLAPDVTGPHGRAWAVRLASARLARGFKPEDDAMVAGWVVEAPWAHPAWHSYALLLMHLRPMPDNRPTKFYLEGATHEIWLYALNPDFPRQPMIERLELRFLTPLNFAAQFIAESDAAASNRALQAVMDICAGNLSPDTDFIRYWAARFGGNMLKDGAGETRLILNPGEDDALEIVIPPHPGPQDLH
jgi:hypothetical protein